MRILQHIFGHNVYHNQMTKNLKDEKILASPVAKEVIGPLRTGGIFPKI